MQNWIEYEYVYAHSDMHSAPEPQLWLKSVQCPSGGGVTVDWSHLYARLNPRPFRCLVCPWCTLAGLVSNSCPESQEAIPVMGDCWDIRTLWPFPLLSQYTPYSSACERSSSEATIVALCCLSVPLCREVPPGVWSTVSSTKPPPPAMGLEL